MKRLGLILLFCMAVTPAWAATKLTVAELKDKLMSMSQAGKEDEEIATWMKGVELTQQLTRKTRAGLNSYAAGPLAAAQVDILEGRSAFLPPPSEDLPTTPAPDAAMQKAILAKAVDYAGKMYAQNPHLIVSKTTSRYQDDAQNTSNLVGLTVTSPNLPAVLVDTRNDAVETDKGVERQSPSRAKTKWGSNGQISEGEPGLAVNTVLQDALAGGKLEWLRWETVEGKSAAVFTFSVDKKRSHFDVNYCCFPDRDTEGGIGTQAGAVQPVYGSIQSVTSWKPFKRVVGYHGQIFVDPDTGTILRVITIAEMKPTDFVHQEMMRVDYGSAVVEGKEYVVPQDSFTLDEVVPNGDSPAVAYSVLHTLFKVDYNNYRTH